VGTSTDLPNGGISPLFCLFCSTVYQLLEEMVDNGWPLTTEPNALKAMIAPPTVLGRIHQVVTGQSTVSESLADGMVSNMPWRKAGVKYAQNEVYVDIVEEFDAIVDVSGQVVSSDINGSIQVQSKLSGVPDLTLTFKNPEVIDDCSFHPCVRYNRYDNDKVISFVPPDGAFELMRFRVKNMAQVITPPIFCNPQLSFGGDSSSHANNGKKKVDGRISISLGLRSNSSLIFGQRKGATQMVEDVVVIIPFPSVVRTANLTANVGSVLFDEAKKVAKWTIGKITLNKKCQLNGSMVLSGSAEENPPLTVKWSIPNASVSGLSVSGLSLHNENYKPYKGVRCLTKSGRFSVRCA